jgi:hypothetical protein
MFIIKTYLTINVIILIIYIYMGSTLNIKSEVCNYFMMNRNTQQLYTIMAMVENEWPLRLKDSNAYTAPFGQTTKISCYYYTQVTFFLDHAKGLRVFVLR